MTHSDEMKAFAEKFRQQELLVTDIEGWRISVRPGQLTLGAMVVACRSGARDMSSLTDQERAGMATAFALAERLSKQTFAAQKINFRCLMMQDPIVHFHVIPRYQAEVSRHGKVWVDNDWPRPPTIAAVQTDDVVLHAIRDDLRLMLEGS